MWTTALQDRPIQFGGPLLVEPLGEGGRLLKRADSWALPSRPSYLIPDGPQLSQFSTCPLGGSRANRHFRSRTAGWRGGERVFDSISALAEEGHTSPYAFCLGGVGAHQVAAPVEGPRERADWRESRWLASQEDPGRPRDPAQRRILLPTRGRCRGRARLRPRGWGFPGTSLRKSGLQEGPGHITAESSMHCWEAGCKAGKH